MEDGGPSPSPEVRSMAIVEGKYEPLSGLISEG